MEQSIFQYLMAYAWPNYKDRKRQANHFFNTIASHLQDLNLPYKKAFCLCYDPRTADRPGGEGDPIVIVLLEKHGQKSKHFRDESDEIKYLYNELNTFFESLNIKYQTMDTLDHFGMVRVDELTDVAESSGLSIYSDCIISDGKTKKETQRVIINASSIDEARKKIKDQTPTGYQVLKEVILEDGTQTETFNAATIEDATKQARARFNKEAVLDEKIIGSPDQKHITIHAFDKQQAASTAVLEATSLFGAIGLYRDLKMITAGRKGFFGIGKKPNTYEVELFIKASLQITYKTKVKVRFEIERVTK
ncbi:MAG: hypothetical protein J7K84_05940 [Deltaproteobacteria bacterium]|nr:hypothetical protein [Deltaproteobacteria bacterium]